METKENLIHMELIKIIDPSVIGWIIPNLDFEIPKIVGSNVKHEIYGGSTFDILSIYPTCFGNS